MSSRGNLSAETMLVQADADATNSIKCEKWVQTGDLPDFSAGAAARNTGELQFQDSGNPQGQPSLCVQTATLPGTPAWVKTANFLTWP